MNRQAARRSALLSLLFVTVYGGCNWFAARRPDVGVWYFEWERQIPFWPVMIVPYLSIDLFFVAAPFLCRDGSELRLFTRRLAVAILAAGVCFLAMPVRFAFERPPVDGWLGALFHAFGSLDRPFNLVPSLHITLAVILADLYWRRTSGLLRMALTAWFVLVGLSTIFTYQHHVIDVAGGLALAALVFYAVREAPRRQPSARNLRAACYYLFGSGSAAALAVAAWPWGAVLFWPAISLAVIGCAYLGLGAAVFAKSNGRIPRATWVILGPCLVGQRASLAWYRRQCRAFDEIAPGVRLGRRLDEREAADAVDAGVTAVLDLTAEFTEAPAFRRIAYKNIPILDLTAPTAAHLAEAVAFVVQESRRGIVYVHCKIGYSRSAAVVGAYLLAVGRARTTDEALAILRGARPSIVVRPEAEASLRHYESALGLPAPSERTNAGEPKGLSVAGAIAAGVARLLCGAPLGLDRLAAPRQRIYFANHTSHLDFLVLWGSLPADVRAHTRPVAGQDYWDRGPIRRCLARRVFGFVLVERPERHGASSYDAMTTARRTVERMANALGRNGSLIIFPEGTRGAGPDVGPFKTGLYHLARTRPDVELVPVFLENLNRILPKGQIVPVPLAGSVTFGAPIRLQPEEDKSAFLARARAALVMARRPCTPPSMAMSRAS